MQLDVRCVLDLATDAPKLCNRTCVSFSKVRQLMFLFCFYFYFTYSMMQTGWAWRHTSIHLNYSEFTVSYDMSGRGGSVEGLMVETPLSASGACYGISPHTHVWWFACRIEQIL